MKSKTHVLFIALFISLTIISCKEGNKATETTNTEESSLNTTYSKAEFTVKGMSCAIGCAASIEKKLATIDGVKSAKVDFEKELAMVEYNAKNLELIDLALAVTSSGSGDIYTVENMATVKEFHKKEASKNHSQCKKACASKDKSANSSCSEKDSKKAYCNNKI